MAWGARQDDDGTWRLCERKGRTIRHVSSKNLPGVQIRFSSQAKAKACADTLNERFWKQYEKHSKSKASDTVPVFATELLETVHQMGGLTAEDYKRITG